MNIRDKYVDDLKKCMCFVNINFQNLCTLISSFYLRKKKKKTPRELFHYFYCFVSVALTAQLTSNPTLVGIMKFDNVILSVGYNNLPAYKSSGKFICERNGLYLISASIASGANNAQYYLYLNNDMIASTYISGSTNYPSTTWNTGTIVLALQLRHSDSVYVKNGMHKIRN